MVCQLWRYVPIFHGNLYLPLFDLRVMLHASFVFGLVIHPHDVFVLISIGPIQRPVNIVWFILDFLICCQVMYYGPRQFGYLSRGVFYTMFLVILALSFTTVLFMSYDLNDDSGAYSAFGQNMMMSGYVFVTLRLHLPTSFNVLLLDYLWQC
jgi:hypothetical protein